jgi:hypothetical protein
MLINLLGFEFGPETELVKVLLLFSSVTLALKTFSLGINDLQSYTIWLVKHQNNSHQKATTNIISYGSCYPYPSMRSATRYCDEITRWLNGVSGMSNPESKSTVVYSILCKKDRNSLRALSSATLWNGFWASASADLTDFQNLWQIIRLA